MTKDKEEPNMSDLEKVFQVPARLKIMSLLMVKETVDFTELTETLNLTRGNCSVHMKMLENKGYVVIEKAFVNNKPKTTYTLTDKGRSDFKIYIDMLEEIIKGLK